MSPRFLVRHWGVRRRSFLRNPGGGNLDSKSEMPGSTPGLRAIGGYANLASGHTVNMVIWGFEALSTNHLGFDERKKGDQVKNGLHCLTWLSQKLWTLEAWLTEKSEQLRRKIEEEQYEDTYWNHGDHPIFISHMIKEFSFGGDMEQKMIIKPGTGIDLQILNLKKTKPALDQMEKEI